ncbi:MAG: hypothetical protein LBQ81_07830 [Zoogloeaceae bacterium]|jgi:hypothetical protein|nr:hypothetical protein [Zoogloeaceae bacterium]
MITIMVTIITAIITAASIATTAPVTIEAMCMPRLRVIMAMEVTERPGQGMGTR